MRCAVRQAVLAADLLTNRACDVYKVLGELGLVDRAIEAIPRRELRARRRRHGPTNSLAPPFTKGTMVGLGIKLGKALGIPMRVCKGWAPAPLD